MEAVGLGRPVVVSASTALDELAVYPNVLTVSGSAGSNEVAGAVWRALHSQPAEAPEMQAWDDCVDALMDLAVAAMFGQMGPSARSRPVGEDGRRL